MRVLVVSAATLMLALPAVAMAQATGGSTATPSKGTSPSNVPMDQNSAGTVGSRFRGIDPASQEQIRKSLEKAGFTNVRILDSAYLVQAQGANGEMVTMMIDTAGGVGAMSGSSGSGTTSGTGPGGSTGSSAGTTTVK